MFVSWFSLCLDSGFNLILRASTSLNRTYEEDVSVRNTLSKSEVGSSIFYAVCDMMSLVLIILNHPLTLPTLVNVAGRCSMTIIKLIHLLMVKVDLGCTAVRTNGVRKW